MGAYASVVEAQDISVLNAPVKCLFLGRLHPLLDPGLADNFPNFPNSLLDMPGLISFKFSSILFLLCSFIF